MTKEPNDQTPTEFVLAAQDCIEGMSKLPAESVDVVVTSPPYNIGARYNSYQDRVPHEKYLRWTLSWAVEVKRILKPNGSFFLNLGTAPSNPLLPHELAIELKSLFVLQNTFHWIKSITIETPKIEVLSVGHFKPINSSRFVNNCHEYVFHLTKHGTTPLDRLSLGVPYADKSNVRRWRHAKGRDVRCRGNVWFIPYETIRSRKIQRSHPATFPVQLAVNCIKIQGYTSQAVMLDPFLGLGHTAKAAKLCGIRKFIGFDIDPEYVKLARLKICKVS
jgi:site-specific DNA-methyltransferase (adenine-specific)